MNLRRGDGRPLVIGHRGAAAVAPENTVASLEAAVAAGVDIVEFDISPGLRLGHSDAELPGDRLSLEVTMERLARRFGKGRAKASVDGEVCCEAQLSFIIPGVGALGGA